MSSENADKLTALAAELRTARSIDDRSAIIRKIRTERRYAVARYNRAKTVRGAALGLFDVVRGIAAEYGNINEVALLDPCEGICSSYEVSWESGPLEWAVYFCGEGTLASYGGPKVFDPRSNSRIFLEPGYSFSIGVYEA